MPEFLVRSDSASRYVRVVASTPSEIGVALEAGWAWAVVFSVRGRALTLEPEGALAASERRLPFAVRLAWFGARHARFRTGFQIVCWLALGLAVVADSTRAAGAPTLLALTGLANVFAWWWSESDQGRLEPGVRRAHRSEGQGTQQP